MLNFKRKFSFQLDQKTSRTVKIIKSLLKAKLRKRKIKLFSNISLNQKGIKSIENSRFETIHNFEIAYFYFEP